MATMDVQAIPSGLTCYALRLKPGQELRSALLEFVCKNNLQSAFVMMCCGSITKATLRLAQKEDGTLNDIKTFNNHYEILSLVGTLSGGQGHLHISLSDRDGNVLGGHVIGDLNIFTTAEVVLGVLDQVRFTREDDPQTGFDELVVQQK